MQQQKKKKKKKESQLFISQLWLKNINIVR